MISNTHTRVGVVLLTVFLVGCSDKSTGPAPVPVPVVDSSLEAQIRALFPVAGGLQDSALAKLSGVRQQVALGATGNARAPALDLAAFTLKTLQGNTLNPGNSGSAAASASTLVDGVFQLAGMEAPVIPPTSLTPDGTFAVVGPGGGEVVTPAATAGVNISPGTFNTPVLLEIARIATPANPSSGPLPTDVKQYPPYYEYKTYPAVPQFGEAVRVGVCQVSDPGSPFYPPEPHDRLRLAHSVGSTIEILERVGVDDFLHCSNTSASTTNPSPSTIFARALNFFAKELAPRELYAAHGGLGGKVKSFSPFGAVDPTLFVVSPKSTYLLTSGDDHPMNPLVVNLIALGIHAGDTIRLQRTGDWSYGPGFADETDLVIGVFSATNNFLDQSSRNRVPGAIGIGLTQISMPTLHGSLDTDISEDFLISDIQVIVPAGAAYFFVGVLDTYFGDNADPDGDLGVRITRRVQ